MRSTSWLGLVGVLVVGTSWGGEPEPADPGFSGRWLLGYQVLMPTERVFLARANLQALVLGVDLRATLSCAPRTDVGSTPGEVRCAFESVALKLAPSPERVPAETTAVAAGLAEDLSHATVSLIPEPNGDVREVQLEGFPNERPRDRQRWFMTRELVAAAVRGLHSGAPAGPPPETWTVARPSEVRTIFGLAQHELSATYAQVSRIGADPVVEGTTAGVFTVLPADIATPGQTFEGPMNVDFSTLERLGAADHRMVERSWQLRAYATSSGGTTSGGSTAVSSLAQTYVSYPYIAYGRLRRLGADEQVELGPSSVVSMPTAPLADRPAWEELRMTSFDAP